MRKSRYRYFRLITGLVLVAGLALSGCGTINNLFSKGSGSEESRSESEEEPSSLSHPQDEDYDFNKINRPSNSRDDGGFFGSPSSGLVFGDTEGAQGGVIGVNSYLWRASLDTISFMPIKSADAFGGVILTDWHSPSETPNERFKLNVYILDRALRADGIRVAAFRQVIDRNSQWRDAALAKKTARKIEDAILTRARQLRLRTANK